MRQCLMQNFGFVRDAPGVSAAPRFACSLLRQIESSSKEGLHVAAETAAGSTHVQAQANTNHTTWVPASIGLLPVSSNERYFSAQVVI